MKIADITFGTPKGCSGQHIPVGAGGGLPNTQAARLPAVDALSATSTDGAMASLEALFCAVADKNLQSIALAGGVKKLIFADLKTLR